MALTDDLMVSYELDEASGNAVDAHNAHDATETGGTIGASTGPGGLNGSRDFEAGDTEHFELADHADISVGDIDFTIACWVNLESKTKGTFFGQTDLTNGLCYDLRYEDGADRFRFYIASGNGFSNLTSVIADTFGSPSLATWYFLIAEHNATANTISISVNNGTADSNSYSAGGYDAAFALQLGRNAFGEYIDGLMSQARLWKRLLTSDEKTALYNGGDGLAYADFGGGAAVNRRRRVIICGAAA